MNKEMKKRIVAVTTIVIIIISSLSIVSFFSESTKNYNVIKETKKYKVEIKDIQNNYIEPLYTKILSEDAENSLKDNSGFYREILDECNDINNMIDKSNIIDPNISNYYNDVKIFITSVENVYKLLLEVSQGNYTNINTLSEEESESYVKRIKGSFDIVKDDYNKLRY